jgi:hypothetical protein
MLVTVWAGEGPVTMLPAVIAPFGWAGTGTQGDRPAAGAAPVPDQCSTGLPSGRGLPPVATDSAPKNRYTPIAAKMNTA